MVSNKLYSESQKMFGIGITEMLVLVLILALMVVPVVIIIAVIYCIMRAQKQSAVRYSTTGLTDFHVIELTHLTAS